MSFWNWVTGAQSDDADIITNNVHVDDDTTTTSIASSEGAATTVSKEQWNQNFLRWAKTYQPDPESNTIGRKPMQVRDVEEYQYYLGTKYVSPSTMNRYYSPDDYKYIANPVQKQQRSDSRWRGRGQSESGGEDSQHDDDDDDDAQDNDNENTEYSDEDMTMLSTIHNIRPGFRSYDVQNDQQNYLRHMEQLNQQSLQYFQTGQTTPTQRPAHPHEKKPRDALLDEYYDADSGTYRPVPRNARGEIDWNAPQDALKAILDPNNPTPELDITAHSVYPFTPKQTQTASEWDWGSREKREEQEHALEEAYDKLLHPLGADYESLSAQQQYERLLDYVFEPVIEDPETFYRVMEKDKRKEWERENPEEAERERLRKEARRVEQNIKNHQQWYKEEVKRLRQRQQRGEVILPHEMAALNKRQDFFAFTPEDIDPDDMVDYTQKYKERILDTTYIDPDFASDLVGVGGKRKVVNAFYNVYHDPVLLADMKRLPGEDPEWITYRENPHDTFQRSRGSTYPSTEQDEVESLSRQRAARAYDEQFIDPHDIIHGIPEHERDEQYQQQQQQQQQHKEEEYINSGKDRQDGGGGGGDDDEIDIFYDDLSRIELIGKRRFQSQRDDYDHHRDTPLSSTQSSQQQNTAQLAMPRINVGLIELTPNKLKQQHKQQQRQQHNQRHDDVGDYYNQHREELPTDPVDFLTQPLYYQYNKQNVDEAKKKLLFEDDQQIEDEIQAIADTKLKNRSASSSYRVRE